MEKVNDDKLGKLISMAKDGTENEKEIAVKFIKKICDKHSLNFDDVMTKTDLKEFELEYEKAKFEDLAFHIFARYGIIDKDNYEMGGFNRSHKIWYKTTLQKHIEVINAFDMLSKAYEKEMKLFKESFELAFYNKHKLWNYGAIPEEERKIPTPEELKKSRIANGMERNLDDVQIRKRLGESR